MNKRVGLAETITPDLGDILDSLASNVVAVNKSGEIIFCSPQFARYLEMPREELIGRHINEFFPGTPLLDVLKDGRPQLGRRLQLKDGVYLVNRTPIWRNGEIVGAISEFQNINEIQNIIDELSSDNARIRELKNLLELILDLSSDGIVAIDRNYVITMANHNFASFFNKTPEEIIGKNVYEVYGESKPIFPRAMETGEAEYGYLGNLNGHEVIANRVPLIRDGEIVGALGVVAFRDVEELYALIKKIRHLKSELDYYKGELERVHRSKFSFDQIIGRNKQFEAVKETARRVAMTSSTVLILGESGTGKELFAHALHTEGLRSKGPFIKVNCAAVPENLLESELFGYVEGAFTGARKGGQPGKFELAHGGTIFLDEIGDMPLSMQAKLLRVLQEKEIERLGDTRPRHVDVRVIAATNQNLEELIGKGRFREDLYYRINVVTLNIPPLRERMDDLELLVEHFIKHFNRQFGLRVTGVSAEVMEILMNHHWPGNVRELENVLERAYNVLDGTIIQKKHLPLYLQKAGLAGGQRTGQSGLPRLVQEAEREAILEALAATKGNKRQAAQLLGISRAGLYKKLKRYQIEG
ncbi:PAS modulated sigma54 specific transcriptional regulator, Fis family [Desulfofundulus kuznetsovii DSM 6115]|uniref:PAS modulated sigma54 specific transcriptional regulator, Fis family n=1 Tax=Desulfofundulus kuznetsovii (strain DSM 6115 / VKM B-1805 / 17) TaxID=760568 RepID=A0AAU8PRR3_DESK7|nr:PAS modulated sigma54 specific transcriptional regulator, Fis family [Desulfofundulus kuznetsovii DSM 6115]